MIDYRKFLGSRNFRIALLSAFNWVPDEYIVRLQYLLQTGKRLKIKNPRRFNEKMQCYKLYYRNPEMLRCTDKPAVRQYVKERGLEDILVPLLGVFEDSKSIDFESLPSKFVAKTTDGGGGNEVLICKDKEGELNK